MFGPSKLTGFKMYPVNLDSNPASNKLFTLYS